MASDANYLQWNGGRVAGRVKYRIPDHKNMSAITNKSEWKRHIILLTFLILVNCFPNIWVDMNRLVEYSLKVTGRCVIGLFEIRGAMRDGEVDGVPYA